MAAQPSGRESETDASAIAGPAERTCAVTRKGSPATASNVALVR